MISTKNSRQISAENRDEKSYLTFTLAGEKYAIDILCVQEIISINKSLISNISKIVGSANHILGFMNFHNSVVPVIDLRAYYGIEQTLTLFNVIIFTKVNNDIIGVIVDSIPDIITIKTCNIKTQNSTSTVVSDQFISSIGILNENLFPIIDMSALLLNERMGLINHLSKEENPNY